MKLHTSLQWATGGSPYLIRSRAESHPEILIKSAEKKNKNRGAYNEI